MIRGRTKAPDDTRDLAARVATLVRAGDVVLLAGDLGAGKTTFAQGFGRALGITEAITSPTFTLMRDYQGEGRLRLLHADVYRLDHQQEIVDLGLTELVDEDAVAIVEWGDAAAPVLPADYLEVRISYGDTDDERHLALTAVGPGWSARVAALREMLDRWADR